MHWMKQCVGLNNTRTNAGKKHFGAPAKNPHLFLLTSHKTAAFTINNKASMIFYSSGKNRGGSVKVFYSFENVH